MSKITDFFSMGGYAPYVWGAYAAAAIILLGISAASSAKLRRLRKEERDLGMRD